MARRRRLVLALLGLGVLTFVLAVSGVMSWWWQFVVDLALAAYVVHLRAEARRARQFRRLHARRPAAATAPEPAAAPPAYEAVDVPARTAAPAPAATATATSGPLVIDEDTWEPVPVPLPTYVTAPVAERPEPAPIVEDGEPLFDQEQWQDDDKDFIDIRDDELVEIVDRRRAVND